MLTVYQVKAFPKEKPRYDLPMSKSMVNMFHFFCKGLYLRHSFVYFNLHDLCCYFLHFFAFHPPLHPALTDAVEKSARAAGVPMAMVEKFSAEVANRLPGNRDNRVFNMETLS